MTAEVMLRVLPATARAFLFQARKLAPETIRIAFLPVGKPMPRCHPLK
ncbi:hypothetical protein [uncultured Paracoccus sp.]|nr:hypothetical protein [uncultured Paracoccus sp.]